MADLLETTSVSRTCFLMHDKHITFVVWCGREMRECPTCDGCSAHSRVSHSVELIIGVSLKKLLFLFRL